MCGPAALNAVRRIPVVQLGKLADALIHRVNCLFNVDRQVERGLRGNRPPKSYTLGNWFVLVWQFTYYLT